MDQERIRAAAIQHVLSLRERWPAAIPASELRAFWVAGRSIFLKGQQGIFKPAELDEPLSIRSALDSPYNDDPIRGTQVLYDFAPRSREHENDGLKWAAEKHLPLIYLVQVKRKPNPEYIAFAPVFVVSWDDSLRKFLIELSEQPGAGDNDQVRRLVTPTGATIPAGPEVVLDAPPLEKSYVWSTVQRRLHQARFRNDVLKAYAERCAVCELHIRPLLDAAHVIPDRDPRPVIVINEGLALCATHHRAFDADILRYDSGYRVRIDLPEGLSVGEGERSMLLAFDGRPLHLPKHDNQWPIVQQHRSDVNP